MIDTHTLSKENHEPIRTTFRGSVPVISDTEQPLQPFERTWRRETIGGDDDDEGFVRSRGQQGPELIIDQLRASVGGVEVLQGVDLKRPVPSEDLIALFKRRQINKDVVSACRQLSIGPDLSFSHAITVPSFAKQRHRPDRHLTMVYIDLDNQELDLAELTGTLDEAFKKSEILLHGPLAIPWKNYKSYSKFGCFFSTTTKFGCDYRK